MKYVLSMALASTMLSSVVVQEVDADPVSVQDAPHDWRGSYFGVQGGGVFGSDATAEVSANQAAPQEGVEFAREDLILGSLNQLGTVFTQGPTDSDFDGVHGGISGGYNFQSGNVVFGIDNDFSFTSVDESSDLGTVELRTLSSVRGRVGFAIDRVLPYVTGGLAYGNVRASEPGGGSDSQFQFGWTAGAGVEAALTDYVSARVQYTYSDLGSDTFNSDAVGDVDIDLGGIHTIRAGVSIKTAPLWNKILGR